MGPPDTGWEGSWWYNQRRSFYRVFSIDGRLNYYQQIGEGKELHGVLQVPDGPGAEDWDYEVPLSNGATIRLSLADGRLESSYRRAGADDWRAPVVAERGPEPDAQGEERRLHKDGKWYTQGEMLDLRAGGPQMWLKAQRAPDPLGPGPQGGLGGPGPPAKGLGKGKSKRLSAAAPAEAPRGPAPSHVYYH